jgi:UDPglucose 6-dehydrogenase
MTDFTAIAIKSTVPPGTTRKYILNRINQEGLEPKTAAVFNPEFLREGSAVMDALNPDRIIVGSNSERAIEMFRQMYLECLGEKAENFISMTIESAELCKYASNSFLATKISFSNEIASLAENIPGVELESVMMGVGADHRISPSMFGAGAGYGGSCLPKDIRGLSAFAKQLGVEMLVLDAVQKVNLDRANHIIEMLTKEIESVKGKKIAVLGLAFKPNTDDVRESPGLRIIKILSKMGADVWAHDPLLEKMNLSEYSNGYNFTTSIDECLQGSEACILMTEWKDYIDLGPEKIVAMMSNKIIIDGRRALVNHSMSDDIKYRTIGKPQSLPV